MLKLPKEHCDNLLDIQHPRQLVLKSEPLTFEHQRGFMVNWKSKTVHTNMFLIP